MNGERCIVVVERRDRGDGMARCDSNLGALNLVVQTCVAKGPPSCEHACLKKGGGGSTGAEGFIAVKYTVPNTFSIESTAKRKGKKGGRDGERDLLLINKRF